MLFRIIATFASVALISQGALAGLTVQQVVDNIGIATTVSGNAANALSQITPTSPPNVIENTGQQLVTNFNTIISDLQGDITAMQATTPLTDCTVAQPIIDALRTFVNVHQTLLATVIGKHGILAQFGVTAPVATVLQSLEAVIDSFAFAMINMIPCASDSVNSDQQQLDQTVGQAITLYQQLCIPNPLYPTLQPVCIGVTL
ncbi:hypothetical protein V8E53_013211 [Lactarius tabidus]